MHLCGEFGPKVETETEKRNNIMKEPNMQSSAIGTHWVHGWCDQCGEMYLYPEQRFIFDETVPSRHNPLTRYIPPEYVERVKLVEAVMIRNKLRRNALGPTRKLWVLSDFTIGKELGSGSFGHVHRAREKKTGFVCVLKSLNRHSLKRNANPKQILREIEIQSRLKHPNILALYNYFLNEATLYLIIEHAFYGSLMKRIEMQKKRRQFLTPREVAIYLLQVTMALEYCHSMGVWHRDIKPENILFNVNQVIKLADFGLSVRTTKGQRFTRCGTKDYLAPELVDGGEYTYNIDNWALGVLAYELSTLRPPFYDDNEFRTFLLIKQCSPTYPAFLEKGIVDLISRLLKFNPVERLSLREVREHPWIKNHTNPNKNLKPCT